MQNTPPVAAGDRVVQPPYGDATWQAWSTLSPAQRAQAKVLWPRETAAPAPGALFLVAEATGRVVRMR